MMALESELLYFKGCPLRCPWCSNPESQRANPEKMLDAVTKKETITGEEKQLPRS